MKSQTDFLRSKVIGPRGLELTPSEVELEVEASVEQSQRLREELYKKHVAPRIEQNRLHYEAKLAAIQEEYEADKKYLAVKNWEYKDQIKKLEAELAQENSFETVSNFSPPSFRTRKDTEPAATIEVAPAIRTELRTKDDRSYRR